MKFKKIFSYVILSSFLAISYTATYASDSAMVESINVSEKVNNLGVVFYDDIGITPNIVDNVEVGISETDGNTKIPTSVDFVDELKDSSRTRGDSKPTTYNDLSSSSYYANFSGTKITSTYTNNYFNGSSANEINIDVSTITTGLSYVKIRCYKVNGGEVTSWSGDPSNKIICFYNLNEDSLYYFKFESKNWLDFLSGSAEIYH